MTGLETRTIESREDFLQVFERESVLLPGRKFERVYEVNFVDEGGEDYAKPSSEMPLFEAEVITLRRSDTHLQIFYYDLLDKTSQSLVPVCEIQFPLDKIKTFNSDKLYDMYEFTNFNNCGGAGDKA